MKEFTFTQPGTNGGEDVKVECQIFDSVKEHKTKSLEGIDLTEKPSLLDDIPITMGFAGRDFDSWNDLLIEVHSKWGEGDRMLDQMIASIDQINLPSLTSVKKEVV